MLSLGITSFDIVSLQAFRLQQESREGLRFLKADGKIEDVSCELANIQASHAETVLELQKTRNLLLLEHRISKDLQVHMHKLTFVACIHSTELYSVFLFLYFTPLTLLFLLLFGLHFPPQGRVKHSQPEVREREGGLQEEDGRKRQTCVKKSSSDQHFTRCEPCSLVPLISILGQEKCSLQILKSLNFSNCPLKPS